MDKLSLYAILLGGKIRKENLMEDHHLVFVVAKTESEAREKAKEKWVVEEVHVDGTQRIENIDGYNIEITKGNKKEDVIVTNPRYSK